MMKIVDGHKMTSLNADLSTDLIGLLQEQSATIKDICTQLATLIEDDISSSDSQTGADDTVLSQRLIQWTADLFAISQDMDYYVSPPVEE